jgi:cystathionine beta-lyase
MYGPAARFCHQFLGPFGISVTVYEPGCGGEIRRLITERTKLIWLESPGSNTMEVEDVPAIVSAARERTVTVACDNTWSTPLLFKPLNHGVDIAIEALTKYVGGHSDLLLGSITARTSGLHEIIKTTARGLGMGVSPDDASLTLRGLQTLSVRLAHVGNAALGLATRLTKVDCIETVLHPGLPSCPGHEFWKRDFAGSSGVFSVVLKEGSQPHLGTALAAMNVFALGASWGGTRSLIVPIPPNHEPAPESRRSGQIIRLSIGLEDPEDLWADLTRFITALEGIETA